MPERLGNLAEVSRRFRPLLEPRRPTPPTDPDPMKTQAELFADAVGGLPFESADAIDHHGRCLIERWTDPKTNLVGAALFSPCKQYRYTLTRTWDAGRPFVQFIGLNPSTADAREDDPTIRRCIGFAKSLGFGGLVMTNLFAFRATDPKVMKAHDRPIGITNDQRISEIADRAGMTIAAWGVHGVHLDRCFYVDSMIGHLHALGYSKDGHPRHPLYMPADSKPVPFAYPRQ